MTLSAGFAGEVADDERHAAEDLADRHEADPHDAFAQHTELTMVGDRFFLYGAPLGGRHISLSARFRLSASRALLITMSPTPCIRQSSQRQIHTHDRRGRRIAARLPWKTNRQGRSDAGSGGGRGRGRPRRRARMPARSRSATSTSPAGHEGELKADRGIWAHLRGAAPTIVPISLRRFPGAEVHAESPISRSSRVGEERTDPASRRGQGRRRCFSFCKKPDACQGRR